jgi:hypothetical protein
MSESEINELQDLRQLYFKEEENMKKIICCLIALVLCLGVLPVSAEETAEPKTKYLNSIVLSVTSDTLRNFTPEEFSEVGCVRVGINSVKQNEEGKYDYKLILTLDKTGKEAVKEAKQYFNGKAGANTFAEDYGVYANTIDNGGKTIYIPVGETVRIDSMGGYIDPMEAAPLFYDPRGVDIIVDPEKFDEDALIGGTLSQFEGLDVYTRAEDDGCENFLAGFAINGLFFNKFPEVKNQKSEIHRYFINQPDVLFQPQKKNYDDVMQKLMTFEGIKAAEVVYSDMGYMYIPEPSVRAQSENEEIAEVKRAACGLFDFLVEITGKSVGDTVVKLGYQYQNSGRFGELNVHVYLKGDVNIDKKVTAVDSLMTLQASVKTRTLSEDQHRAAKYDNQPEVSPTDALRILQTSVGLLSAS